MARKKAPPGALLKRPLKRPFIAEWRAYRGGIRQEAFAARVEELLGTSFTPSTLSRIETAKSPYNQRQLEAMAEALQCEPSDLINVNPLQENAFRSIQEQLLKASPAKQKEILDVVSVMLRKAS